VNPHYVTATASFDVITERLDVIAELGSKERAAFVFNILGDYTAGVILGEGKTKLFELGTEINLQNLDNIVLSFKFYNGIFPGYKIGSVDPFTFGGKIIFKIQSLSDFNISASIDYGGSGVGFGIKYYSGGRRSKELGIEFTTRWTE
jgi:hypothetical protein